MFPMWLQVIEQQLLTLENEAKNTVQSHKLSKKLQTLELERQNYTIENKKLKEHVDRLETDIQDHPKVQILLDQISTLKLENAEVYKSNATNTNQANENTLKTIRKENKELQQQLDALNRKLIDSTELIGEKDRVIQILRDELSAHQLELVQKESQLNTSLAKQKELEEENRTLVERWIVHKEKEATQMNEANAFLESALKTKESMANRVFSLFSNTQTSKQSIILEHKTVFEKSTLPLKPAKLINSGHDDDINCISISSDGTMLATAGNDKKLIIHSVATGSQKWVLTGYLMAIMSTSFSPSGEHILASSNDNSIRIWDINTRRISGSHDRSIKIWDLVKGVCAKTIFTLSSCNDLASASPDGSLIVSGHLDNNVRIWDTKSGQMVREITGIHFGQVTNVQVSPDGHTIMSLSRDNTIKLIDSRMYMPVATLSAPSFRIRNNWVKGCFSSDGQYVACGGVDGNVYIWQNAVLVRTLSKQSSDINGVVWSSLGGSSLFSVSGKERTIIEWGDDY